MLLKKRENRLYFQQKILLQNLQTILVFKKKNPQIFLAKYQKNPQIFLIKYQKNPQIFIPK